MIIGEYSPIITVPEANNCFSINTQVIISKKSLTMVPRENKNNAYAKFGGTNKEYYGIFRSGL